MATSDTGDIDLVTKLRQDHELLTATAIYLVVSVVVYVWFAGPVGPYFVHPQVAIGGLLSGAILFIPLIAGIISKSEYEIEAKEAASRAE